MLLLVIGVFLGCIFTFGMQYWNQEVTRDSCTIVETQFIDYRITKSHRSANREVVLTCSDSERYFIDGVLINSELKSNLSQLKTNDEITLLIHPTSNSVVEFSAGDVTLINFDDFDILLDKISSGNLNKISKNLITRCKTTEVLSPIEIIKIDKNNQEDKYKKEIKELEELIDTSFIKDNGAFINIEGHGYTKSIRKKLITCIEIKGKEVSKEEEDYFECKAGEFLGNEVLIHINGKTEPIKIYFSTIVYWPKYEDDLAKRFYNKLMNDINWD